MDVLVQPLCRLWSGGSVAPHEVHRSGTHSRSALKHEHCNGDETHSLTLDTVHATKHSKSLLMGMFRTLAVPHALEEGRHLQPLQRA
jgi:hypothetical protein